MARTREGRSARAFTRNNGRFGAGNIYDTAIRDTKTGANLDSTPGMNFLRQSKGDMKTASSSLRAEAEARKASLDKQKGNRRNNGQYKSKIERSMDRASARAKQSYDIKRAFGVSVG